MNRQRAFCAAIMIASLLLAGVLPALHQHEAEKEGGSHCHDHGPPATTHLETAELAHHEPCGLCAKTLSLMHFERPRAALIEELVVGNFSEGRQILPPRPPGPYGACRAPPSA